MSATYPSLIEVKSSKLRRNKVKAGGPWIAAYMVAKYMGTDAQGCAAPYPLPQPKELTAMNTNFKSVAAHVLRHLARAQSRGQLVRLDELAGDIGVRREDVRHVVTSLHDEGHVDAKRMKLTLSGFAIAASMRECKLAAPRLRQREMHQQMRVA